MKKTFQVIPQIVQFETCEEFLSDFAIGEGDLIFCNEITYRTFLEGKSGKAVVIMRESYGDGEPSDELIEAVYSDIKDISYQRVIAVGGGTVIDAAKLFALKQFSPVLDLYDGKIKPEKEKTLLLVPTTCGTGSETTNISILELKERHTKMGLAVPELYGDYAILIPELLRDLPMRFFATSSIDALIHAMESYTSPKANEFTEIFSLKAIEKIIAGYQYIVKNGEESRKEILGDFMTASTYAGIAFGNAGCAAVHALSYPLGANYHVPHGEANYVFLTEVYMIYMKIWPKGRIRELNRFLAELLHCEEKEVYQKLEELLSKIIVKKSLHEYGMKKEEIKEFTESVLKSQQRLLKNNYVPFGEKEISSIYQTLF